MVQISGHPVLAHKITIMRSSETRSGTFRAVLREVTYHLAYEATSLLTTKPIAITVPIPNKGGGIGSSDAHEAIAASSTMKNSTNSANSKETSTMEWPHGQKLKEHVALIPILRSGLGMVDAMLELVPNAAIHHIGMYKRLGNQQPVQYFNRLPRKCTVDVAYVLDPVIQTSGTVMSVINILKKWGVAEIHVISVIVSKTGLKQITDAHPDVHITAGAIDEEMNQDGVILPGLGDPGDRQFDTDPINDDEVLLHPSKRTRTMD
eukprot:CAMPEP_0198140552 /NCGR_PEP_ID=MMETSP1443-20131203/3702_1 /TAXON_ID=186043 /ORGANISM="Entomoneis sp., Strain CCMP2396" /LENGTH=262 /DNA_ID=CAMNT_0043803017 /DNA_START=254 /DNA_END=1042 /DNA_ORIENTATION=+